MTENDLRAAVVEQARSWLGCHESDGSHRPIIDLYNQYRRPGDYKMTYADLWCAAFSSAVGMAVAVAHSLPCKPYELIPSSAACDPKIAQYEAMGRWIEDDNYLPSPGDEIFYDWEDSGVGDDHGSSDHVGIVVSVDGSTVTVIEGNKSDSVCYRSVQRGGLYIRGYGLPDYERYADGSSGRGEIIAPDEPENGTSNNSADSAASGVHNSQSEATGENRTSSAQATALLPVLRKGAGIGNPSEVVRAAQLLLIGRGFRCGSCGADGEFGRDTHTATLLFQFSRGLKQDGEIGPQTWAALIFGG